MKRLIGGILMSVGILIGATSGLCTLFGIWTVLFSQQQDADFGWLFAIPGLIFLAVGVGIFFGGRALLRSARIPPDNRTF